MLIRINCPNPNCKKQLRIDAKHVGKKIECVGCKQHIRLPSAEELKLPAPTTAATTAGVSEDEQIIDFDMLASQAVNEEKGIVEETNKTEMVEFTCPQCDDPVKVAIEHAGKRTPCPSCRRIIAVPKVDTGKPKDWREKQAQGPTLAKKEEVKLEGAWGNEAVTRVSIEALEEAKALPKVKRKLTWADYVRYGTFAAILLVIVGISWWYWGRYRSSAFENNTLAALRSAVQDLKQTPEMSAVLRRGLGEWMIKTGASIDIKRDGLAELKKALSTSSDPLWNWVLACDLAELVGPAISLDANPNPANMLIDSQFLVQLISSVKPGEPRESVVRTLCRSVLARTPQDKMEMARALLTSVIKQAMPPTAMAALKSAPGAPTQDFSEQLNGIGVLAQELIRLQAKDAALLLVGKTTDRGERANFKKGMAVPKAFVAAMAALGQQDFEVNKEQEPEFELGKMVGLMLVNQDAAGNEIYKKRQEVGFAEVNLLPFLELAEQSIMANRMPEALSRLTQAMAIAQIYPTGRNESWKLRVYAHVRLCELTARAGEFSLAEERVSKLKLSELPLAESMVRALIARQRPVQAGDGESLLAGIPAGSAGQAMAAYTLSRKQAELIRHPQTTLASQLPEGNVKIAASLGGLIGHKLTQPVKDAK